MRPAARFQSRMPQISQLLFFILISLSTQNSFAAVAITCDSATWAEIPMLQAGVFTGSLQASCDLSEANESSLIKIGQHFQAKVSQDVIQVFEGPVLDGSLGVPAVRYDELVQANDGQIRNLIRFGGNGADLFLYSSHSKEIHFSGTAGYLRRLDIDFKLEKRPSGHLKLTLTNLTNVQKPALVPDVLFLSMAKSRSISQFEANLQALAKEVSENE